MYVHQSKLNIYFFVLWVVLVVRGTTFGGDPNDPNDPNCPSYFTVVVLPDTQKYVDRYPEIFFAQTEWIEDHAESENIVFVTHVGDIVENYGFDPNRNETEWLIANEAMSVLDAVCPWGTTPGNHDYDHYNPLYGATQYLSHFGPDRFAESEWYGGYDPNGLSSYQHFMGGDRDFLMIHVECDFPTWALTWLQKVLDQYPDTPTILTTHIYMNSKGRYPYSFLNMYTPDWPSHTGEEVWQEVIQHHPQVFMVLCGHITAERTQISLNQAKQDVIEMLVNYQRTPMGGEGYLRLLRFHTDRKELEILTYSPWLDQYQTDEDSQFILPLDLDKRFEALPESTPPDDTITH